jgi:HNH endonuclease
MSETFFNKDKGRLFELAITRFWKNVYKTDSCWLWIGTLSNDRYGSFRAAGKTYTAHRFSFFLAHGYLPPSTMDVMHTCDNKRCVNPDHLVVGTRKDNIHDYLDKGGHYFHRGEKNGRSKVTDEQYAEMKAKWNDGATMSSVAREYGITPQSFWMRLVREKEREMQ